MITAETMQKIRAAISEQSDDWVNVTRLLVGLGFDPHDPALRGATLGVAAELGKQFQRGSRQRDGKIRVSRVVVGKLTYPSVRLSQAALRALGVKCGDYVCEKFDAELDVLIIAKDRPQ